MADEEDYEDYDGGSGPPPSLISRLLGIVMVACMFVGVVLMLLGFGSMSGGSYWGYYWWPLEAITAPPPKGMFPMWLGILGAIICFGPLVIFGIYEYVTRR